MVKSTIGLDVARQRGVEDLSLRYDPVKDGALETFSIVCPRVRGTLLDLQEQ